MGDEEFYQTALKEFEGGNTDDGLLAKAWVNANGEESRQKIEYVKLRVSQLKATRVKRTATAAGAAVVTAAPGILAVALFIAKAVALVLFLAFGVALLAKHTGESNPGNIIGSVLAGLIVIYLISKAIEWTLLKRVIKNRDAMIILSTVVSFLLIFSLWYSGKDQTYAIHPNLLLSFLLATILLILGRIYLPSRRQRFTT